MIDDRTGLEILDEEECWTLLASKDLGRVAVSIANKPDVFPVNYKVDGGSIYVNTVAGTKLAAAVLGAGVAFEVDDLDETKREGWSVVVHGSASEVEMLDEVLHVQSLGIQPWAESLKQRYLRIAVDEITGRRIVPR